jgi:glucose-6-phosphate dehydrogenase assembly protein OpcA
MLFDQPREVDVLSIEDELALLWKASGDGDRAGAAPIRACSLNLIVLTDDRERLSAAEQLIGDVTVEHPARTFLVLHGGPSAGTGLGARVSVRCTIPLPGRAQVCCEQITLHAGGEDSSKLPSVVASLLVPDVPSVLVWKMPLSGNDPLLRPLSDLTDRAIIDSSEELDPPLTLRAWNAFVLDPERRALAGDLAWTHLTAWRSALAHLFDPGGMRGRLGAISGVEVHYTVSYHPPHSGASQAMLLFSWLAARLHWATLSPFAGRFDGNVSATVTSEGRPIHLAGVPVSGVGVGPGGIERVRLTFSGGWCATFTSGAGHGSILTRVEGSAEKPGESVLWVRDRDEAAVLAGELELQVRDRIYEEAILSMERLFGGSR